MTKHQLSRILQLMAGIVEKEYAAGGDFRKINIKKNYPKELRTIQRVLGLYNE